MVDEIMPEHVPAVVVVASPSPPVPAGIPDAHSSTVPNSTSLESLTAHCYQVNLIDLGDVAVVGDQDVRIR